jgi:hypothetical protein
MTYIIFATRSSVKRWNTSPVNDLCCLAVEAAVQRPHSSNCRGWLAGGSVPTDAFMAALDIVARGHRRTS